MKQIYPALLFSSLLLLGMGCNKIEKKPLLLCVGSEKVEGYQAGFSKYFEVKIHSPDEGEYKGSGFRYIANIDISNPPKESIDNSFLTNISDNGNRVEYLIIYSVGAEGTGATVINPDIRHNAMDLKITYGIEPQEKSDPVKRAENIAAALYEKLSSIDRQ